MENTTIGLLDGNLSIILVQRIAIIAVFAYVLSHMQVFRLLFKEKTTAREKMVLVFIFSLISIVGTYFGIPIEGALANVRDTGAIVAGLLAGPAVGTAVGMISGSHRIYLGGYTALQCGLATMIGGVLAGYIHVRTKPKSPEWITGIITGSCVILLSMGLIILFAKPYETAVSLVTQITIPMVLANALGIAIFMIIIHNAREHQTKIAALQTHKALRIANITLPHFRQGLNSTSAEKVAANILSMTSAAAVAITDLERVLAHVGLGSDHHVTGMQIVTKLTRACLTQKQVTVAQSQEEIGCKVPACPLKSAIVVPLYCREELVGTLKIYYAREEALTALDIEFAQGLGQVFSTQLELSALQHKAELAAKAELKALRAQINPHFLFNALNTIVSFCRTNPEKARSLLIELSEFFRRSLKTARDFVTLSEELEHVDSYLALEQARFGDRLTIKQEIEPDTLNILIPTFTLQPLVENAVKHGLLAKTDGGTITIVAKKIENQVEILINDDGIGISPDIQKQVLEYGFGKGAGVGLTNVNERLKTIYGTKHALTITSIMGEGTSIRLHIPVNMEVVDDD
ncbi:sensor histidine kinase [Sporomusa acidovorans]|uniref:histidine kinase n=1 Tax=Sporomusa acidovorans (strain ATCC 49682 / DSM 3132 / Mol) TaxID=1123286 RepID=A0ABZ3J349_SPOA4|nr:sensor histidine kinase [Sporomusa acidovorans]OZC20309.1 sensor histidine kinase YpdA [Sporomusa acidovorans DSM 3132]SDD38407.1 two-component system, LytT family, sensor histidine kinase LytS [Sporomusa acidovorans]